MALYATNGYALRAYAEHPTNLWPLDDDASYLTLISDDERDMSNASKWVPNTDTTIVAIDPNTIFYQKVPFDQSFVSKISFTSTPQDGVVLGATSTNLFDYSTLNLGNGSFSVNFYVLTSILASNIDSYDFGIIYTEGGNDITVPAPSITTIIPNEWMRLSYTFNIPENAWSSIKVYFNISLSQPVSTSLQYDFYVNGISIGQWSETTSDKSLGAARENLPQSVIQGINAPGITQGVTARSYGISDDNAYYLIEDNQLLAVNYGIPMVYGSDNCTKIVPSANGNPSLVFPGLGIMNKAGGNNVYTVEFWLRIDNNGKEIKRIWGPTYSSDGIYVGNNCISFSVNENFSSYPINDWYRPMLISFIISDGTISFSINGEIVTKIPYSFDNLYFPEEDRDWVGFYGNTDFEIFEIDGYAVYPYSVPQDVSKRRFVWGQGVSSPEDINSAYRGTTAYIDYSFSDYNASYKYPGNGRWDAGSYNNLLVNQNSIQSPEYVLPNIVIEDNRLYSDFVELNKLLQVADTQPFFYFQPDPLGEVPFTTPVYLLWNNFAPIQNNVKSFYGVFEGVEQILDDNYHPLFIIKNAVTGYTLDALLVAGQTDDDVKLIYRYYLEINPLDPDASIILEEEFPYNQSFVCGFNIDKLYSKRFSNFPPNSVFEFFSNPNQLTLQIGSDGIKTFTGKTYAIGFADEQVSEYLNISSDIDEIVVLVNFVTGENIATVITKTPHKFIQGETVTIKNCGEISGKYKIRSILSETSFTFDINFVPSQNPFIAPTGSVAYCSYFNNNGFTNTYNDNSLYDQMGSYTFLPKLNFNQFYFDIGFNGTWQETYPLSYFAQPTKGIDNSIYWDLDLLQFNVSCPSNYSILRNDEPTNVFTYEDLENEYLLPVQRFYRELNADFFTYQNLKDNSNSGLNHYDFKDSETRFFLSFQYSDASTTLALNDIETFYSLSGTDVIDPSLFTNPLNVAFEAKDRTVFYAPPNTSLQNMIVVLYIQTNCKGIATNPFKIREMSIISKSFDNNSEERFNKIGTRYGTEIYSYERSSFFFNTEARVPYGIYTQSTPYLYLTKYSGIETLSEPNPGNETGIAVPLNSEKINNFKITGMQVWAKYSEEFPTVPKSLFNIWHPRGVIYFEIVKDSSSDRGIVTVRSTNPSLSDTKGYSIFQNGIQVKNFYIEKNRWSVLGVNFGKEIIFPSVIGYINLNPGAVFNNISFYESTTKTENSSYIYQVWDDVRYYWENGDTLDWDYWRPQTWDNVLRRFVSSRIGINPADLCNVYFGTNRFVVDDKSGIKISNTFPSTGGSTTSTIVYTNAVFDNFLY